MAGKKGMHDKHRFSEEYLNRLRGKIEASKLLKALEDHVLNGKEMSQSQVQAANVLLRKVLPELNATEITNKGEGWIDVMKRLAEPKRRGSGVASEQQTPQIAVQHDDVTQSEGKLH